MSKIEMSKQYRTRDGREVRIYATDHDSPHPVVGAIKSMGRWYGQAWNDDGTSGFSRHCDLIEVRPRIKLERWVNVYRSVVHGEPYTGGPWLTRGTADYQKDSGERIACVKITIDCDEGEGL